MLNVFKEALEDGEFVVTCEMIPGRGAHEDAQAREFEHARDIYGTGRVHAISITDNPGGNPALLADGVAADLLGEGVTPLVHFTCKDRSRNQIASQLYELEHQGIENILFMTGDYQATGWSGRARPVFDLDSVQIQTFAAEMNAGLVVETPRGPVTEQPAHIYAGGVMNPFKYREGELIPQYLKVEKKIISGARFLISQLGYDARKMQEALMYVRERGYDTPLIANIFLLSAGAARLMRAGAIAGCHVSDELMSILEEESKAEDKGKAARLERAAKMVAIAKGLGYAGVHIGGFALDAEKVTTILDRAIELADSWRDCAREVSYGEPDGYYLYEPELDATGEPTGLNITMHGCMSEDISGRKLFKGYGLSRFFHYWVLTLDKRFGKLLARVMDRRERKHGRGFKHGLEHMSKAAIYGCLDCGDCGLEACIYTCPMTQCPKCQRNGPCGGSMDGWCEVYPQERYCIFYKAYHRVKRYDEIWRLTSFITPPNDWEYFETSAWSNYTHRRDNAARRQPVSIGSGATAGGITDAKGRVRT